MSWRSSTETSLGVSFESYLRRQWDVQRDVVTTSLTRLVVGWVERGDISYQNFNTGENLYNFLLAQQDGQTAPVPKKNSYRYSFEKCIQNFLPSFSIDDVEKFDLYSNKNAKHLFYRFNDCIEMSGGKRQSSKHTLKVKDSIGLRKIEERDQQFLAEKLILSVEFKNPYENSIEKNPEIFETIENNYRIIRRVYQHIYSDIADIFFEYVHSLELDEIQQLDDNIKTKGWRVINLLEIDNALEPLSTFQLFYHNNGRLPLTNGLFIVPDGEVPQGEEEINLKNLYERFPYTKSPGLVSMQVLGVLGTFFPAGVKELKNAITEWYKNLSYAILIGRNNFNFDAISDLISRLSFPIKNTTLTNRDKKEKEDAKKKKQKR